jgi:hypothetical protein
MRKPQPKTEIYKEKLKEDVSIHEYLRRKEAYIELDKLNKDDLIKRYLYRMSELNKKSILAFLYGFFLCELIILAILLIKIVLI